MNADRRRRRPARAPPARPLAHHDHGADARHARPRRRRDGRQRDGRADDLGTKDRDLALQAAEAALRDGEQDVASNVSPSTAFTDGCTSGLCTPPAQRDALGALASLPVDDPQLGFDWSSDGMVRQYGQYTGAAAFPSVSQQPRYVIEKFSYLGTPAGESVVLGSEPVAPGVGYRITARGVGARPETVVVLQSIYATR